MTKKLDYAAICGSVPPKRSVEARGGFTWTALNCGCEIFEEGHSLRTLIVSSYETLGEWGKKHIPPEDLSNPNPEIIPMTMCPIQIGNGQRHTRHGWKKEKGYVTPQRHFNLRVSPDVPKNVALLLSQKGTAVKITVSKDEM